MVPAFIRSTGSTTTLLRTTPSGQLPEVVTMTTKCDDVRRSTGSVFQETGSLLGSQDPASGPCTELPESSQHFIAPFFFTVTVQLY